MTPRQSPLLETPQRVIKPLSPTESGGDIPEPPKQKNSFD
jgi:hypothetical protein